MIGCCERIRLERLRTFATADRFDFCLSTLQKLSRHGTNQIDDIPDHLGCFCSLSDGQARPVLPHLALRLYPCDAGIHKRRRAFAVVIAANTGEKIRRQSSIFSRGSDNGHGARFWPPVRPIPNHLPRQDCCPAPVATRCSLRSRNTTRRVRRFNPLCRGWVTVPAAPGDARGVARRSHGQLSLAAVAPTPTRYLVWNPVELASYVRTGKYDLHV